MTETICYPSLNDTIVINKMAAKLTKDYVQPYEFEARKVFDVLEAMKYIGSNHPDRRTKVVKKAAWLIYMITHRQTFPEANKRTAWLLAREFIRRNGYSIPFEDNQMYEMQQEIGVYHDTYSLFDVEARINGLMR